MFLRLNRTNKEIKEAINWSSFKNMKALENKQMKKRTFVRRGQVNEWKTILTQEQQNKMNYSFGKVLRELGYIE